MKRKINFALIGCGRIAYKHIEGIVYNCSDINLVAVSDIFVAKMDEILVHYKKILEKENITDYKSVKKYKDYQLLLQDAKVDVVLIATESGKHPEITLEAIKKDKHVIVEKPMALSTNKADEMIDLANKMGKLLAVCHQNRFNPTVKKLREAVESNAFSKITHAVASIRWNRNDAYYLMDDWHGTLALDGGILLNQCLHNIDLLCWMLGKVDYVYGEIDTFLREIETEDTGLAVVRFKSGAIGLIEGSVCIYPNNLEETFNIFGQTGTVRIGGIALNKIIDWKFADSTYDINSEEISYETNSVYGYGHNLLFKDMVDAIRNGRKPLVDGIEGKKAIELILGIYKSARTGEIIDFPLGDYSTLTEVISD